MGGSVRVESEGENKGTSFIIQLTASSQIMPKDLVQPDQQIVFDRERKEELNNYISKLRSSNFDLDQSNNSDESFQFILQNQIIVEEEKS